MIDSFALAVKVFESGFRPDFLVGLWRGGSAVGIAVQEGLDYLGVPTDHITVRTSYAGPEQYSKHVKGKGRIQVHGLRYLLERVEDKHSLLIVDDVFSTGRSVQAVIDKLKRKARCNTPHDIRTAAVWFRDMERTARVPDYFLHETAEWLVLPYEIPDMTVEEIAAHKPELAAALAELAPQKAS